jgi:hypothetical protein
MLHITGFAVDDIVFSIDADEDYFNNYANAKDSTVWLSPSDAMVESPHGIQASSVHANSIILGYQWHQEQQQ